MMQQQMSLFQEGGLEQDGGTVDPVSGNEVPVGSAQEEVRDDIPAQLSEGEFVFPADVVRFLGLEFLMNLRQRAKAGLKKMEEMGQMGNSEEATIPDDVPFTIDDLDMEDEPTKMQTGGDVNPDPTPPNETPIILPRVLTIALPVTPLPPPPIKSTLGGPQRRTLVLQFGADGSASIALSILSKRGLICLFNEAFSIIVPILSSIFF